MRYWWVNQGSTYQQERDGGLMWAPQQAPNGQTKYFWSLMTEVQPGDTVFHYCRGVQAVSTVIEPSVEAPLPKSLPGGVWERDGWLVRTDYRELAQPLQLDSLSRRTRIAEGGPFNRLGAVKQGYLFEISREFADLILSECQVQPGGMAAEAAPRVLDLGRAEARDEVEQWRPVAARSAATRSGSQRVNRAPVPVSRRKQQVRHPELAAEQRHLDETYAMAEEVCEKLRGETQGAHQAAAQALQKRRKQRYEELCEALDSAELLYFGRLDFEEGRSPLETDEPVYVGRVGLLDGDGDPRVLSWKTDAAAAFYQASRAQNGGVARRRSLKGEKRLLLDLADEVLGDLPTHLAGAEDWASPQDLLLAELERRRDGEMRDIVVTIQEDQDRLIREDLDQVLVIQGGPGTGKTAVGLHRASYLLHKHSAVLSNDSVLVIAPNKVFLNYIEKVLPGLGTEAVQHATVSSLGPMLQTSRVDEPEARRVKGDARMAEVINRYVQGRVTRAKEDVLVAGELTTIPADVINEILGRLPSQIRTFNGGRDALRQALVRWVAANTDRRAEDVRRELRKDSAFENLITRTWPSLSPMQVVADLLTGPRRLQEASKKTLSSAERKAILQSSIERLDDMAWSSDDVPLVDEAQAVLDGTPVAFKHVIVDEAQDLSPMQLRMVGRRCPSKSMTVLGDLAQSTSLWPPATWSEVASALAPNAAVNEQRLTTGYRVPTEIMDQANQYLPTIGVDVEPTTSVRSVGVEPTIEAIEEDDLLDELADRLKNALHRDGSTGVLVSEWHYDWVRDHLQAEGVKFGEASLNDLHHRVTLVTHELAKGLEFDEVVFVAGGEPLTDEAREARLRFVAMTRAVQELTVFELPRPETKEKEEFVEPLDGFVHQVPAIRCVQDGVTLYVAALPAHVISDVGVVDEYDPELDDSDPEQGYQRAVQDSRAKKIAKFLLDPSHNRLMPTAATLTSRQRLRFDATSINGEEQQYGILHLAKPVYIVDGQHRTAGFTNAAEDDDEIANFPRPVVIMENIPKHEEIRQFQTINSTAKSVRTDLADRLLNNLGEFDTPTQSWKSRALDITDHLAVTPRGVWKGNITMPNGARGIATQRTMTESLKIVLNGVLKSQDTPIIAGALNNYWSALRRLMPEVFDEPKRFVVQKSVGVFAWHEVAAEVFFRLYVRSDFTEQAMFDLLKETGEYVDPSFWLTKKEDGRAPMYGGRGGFSTLAQEIIAELPARQGPGSSEIAL